jgi:DNA-binding NarL/FixJ family response regulator
VQAIKQLGLFAPTSRVLVLTRGEQNRVVEAIIAGAHGYIAGESVLSSKSAGKLLQRIRELDIPVKTSANAAIAIRTVLTERELEIFTRLASGKATTRSRATSR